ncbi:MAG: hypothetical protein EHM55_08650 [Acidobacteria bacterium]|nr:MAG: hypothetical protein EHM55_08650 [Acidobacteriota bacterium]
MRTRNQSVNLIVRRGALRRFHKLTQRAANLPVSVCWDRRLHDRRASDGDVPDDRRNADRRRTPPFTWEVGDFVVVGRVRAAAKRARP